ncbi:hypothetical protein [Mesorhizobium sp. Cs1299R1N3]|uniref:hypothetical protein n=1 Tax=Mesorhizobium sp. Cs1299R1N3 TaxID=3015173 RepID=UPI003FA59413
MGRLRPSPVPVMRRTVKHLTYDGQPTYTVSIRAFLDGKVAHETQYFGDPFEPVPSRVQRVERIS